MEYIDKARKLGIHVTVYRMDNKFGSIHGVPEETMEKMRKNFVDFPGETIVRADD